MLHVRALTDLTRLVEQISKWNASIVILEHLVYSLSLLVCDLAAGLDGIEETLYQVVLFLDRLHEEGRLLAAALISIFSSSLGLYLTHRHWCSTLNSVGHHRSECLVDGVFLSILLAVSILGCFSRLAFLFHYWSFLSRRWINEDSNDWLIHFYLVGFLF